MALESLGSTAPETPVIEAAPRVTGVETPPLNPGASKGSWVDGISDQALQGWALKKGLASAEAMAKSYQQLEQLFGADRAGQTLHIPKSDAPPAEWGKVYDKLGRPATPTGYTVPEPLAKDPLTQEFLTTFHEVGITQKQAEKVLNKFLEASAQARQKQESGVATGREEKLATIDAEVKGIVREWGGKDSEKMQAFRLGRVEMDLTEADVEDMFLAVGAKKAIGVISAAGRARQEDEFRTAKSGSNTMPGTPQGAQALLAYYQSNPKDDAVVRYMSGDPKARADMERLHKLAHAGKR